MEEVKIEKSYKKNKAKELLIKNFNKATVTRRVQKFGGWLSAMIMPIIGVIIGWGLLTAFFFKDGWVPVKAIDDYIISNAITYLIPILIGFCAGRIVHENRGGVIGAFVTIGIIVGNQYNPGWWVDAVATPQFLGAMIVGPIAAGVLKAFDKALEGRIKQGFEMLVNNFSLGIIGALLTVGAFYGFCYVTNGISYVLMLAVEYLSNHKVIFLSALIIEPAKILFLNNAINHGVLTPIGLEMVNESGKSILFLLEANPGPGLGVLLTLIIFDKKLRGQAVGASVIQFFGGIHEVYFPFVLMRFQLVLALIGGGLVGDAVFQIMDAGLVSPASPGSIIAIFLVANHAPMNYAALAVGVAASCGTSLGLGSLIFLLNKKRYKNQNLDQLDAANKKMVQLKGKESNYVNVVKPLTALISKPKLIIFACEAGMGSSAMGAGLLRKKIKAAGLNIDVKNYPIKELPVDSEFIITQEALTNLAKNKSPNAHHRSISNFLDANFYDGIINELRELK